jgi:hypothetical protein
LEHVVTIKTASIEKCGNYKLFLLQHVVTMKNISIGTCGNYKDCFYWNMR